MRNRRKAVSLLTGLLVTAQLFPTAALAADSSESALNKAPGYQDFPAYYSDSAHADDQVTHPDVVVLEEPWNGYRYWAVYTPNVMRISIYENPSIVASSDGVHWVEPEGLSNPIEPQPPSTRYPASFSTLPGIITLLYFLPHLLSQLYALELSWSVSTR